MDLKREVQKVVIEIAVAAEYSKGQLGQTLVQLGLPQEVTTDTSHMKGAEIEVPTQLGKSGERRDRTDFTPAALEREDAKALRDFRWTVWFHFKCMYERGEMPEAQVFGYLEQLGFTPPEVVSTIDADTPDGAVRMRIKGTVTKDEVTVQLEKQYTLPQVTKARAAFPDAEIVTKAITWVVVDSRLEWDAAEKANGLTD